jgi:hypothetical protein
MPIDAYQQRANECFRLAANSPGMDERTTWRELALCWLRLSEHAEEFRNLPTTHVKAALPDLARGGAASEPV